MNNKITPPPVGEGWDGGSKPTAQRHNPTALYIHLERSNVCKPPNCPSPPNASLPPWGRPGWGQQAHRAATEKNPPPPQGAPASAAGLGQLARSATNIRSRSERKGWGGEKRYS